MLLLLLLLFNKIKTKLKNNELICFFCCLQTKKLFIKLGHILIMALTLLPVGLLSTHSYR